MLKRILQLYKQLFVPEKELSAEDMQKQADNNREEALIKAARLKSLINSKTGWNEFKEIVQEYIDECHIRKLKIPLHRAKPAQLKELELFDSDVAILEWVLQIPEQFIKATEEEDGEQ